MKKYFYAMGTTHFGPFTTEELREKRITRETSVWSHELGEWKKAGTVKELNELFELTPPPLPTLAQENTNHNEPSIQRSSTNKTIDIFVFSAIACLTINQLIILLITRVIIFHDTWYYSPIRYFIFLLHIISAVIPIIFAFSIKNNTLKIIAIILSVLLSVANLLPI